MSWVSRFFPLKDLGAIDEAGAFVDVEVEVLTPDYLDSPLSPERGAAVRWTLLESATMSRREGSTSILVPILQGWRGESLLVRSGQHTMAVPLRGARYDSRYVDPEDGVPLDSAGAARIYGSVAHLGRSGFLYVRELFVNQGQKLRVRGHVTRNAIRPGDYRSAPREDEAELVARHSVVLRDA